MLQPLTGERTQAVLVKSNIGDMIYQFNESNIILMMNAENSPLADEVEVTSQCVMTSNVSKCQKYIKCQKVKQLD